MKNGLFNRRIPTSIALLLLLIVVGISTLLIKAGVFYIGKAAPDTIPQNLAITNITDTTFSVVFTTNDLADAVVTLPDAKVGKTIILDDRDKKSGSQNKYFSHHITVPELLPNTNYNFKIIVGGKEYENPLYIVKTGQPILTQPPVQKPLFGKVLFPDGTVGSDTMMIVKTPSSQVISAITNAKGEFIIPTNSIRDLANSSYIVLNDDSQFTITATHQNMSAKVTANFSIAQNLPPITLLSQYTFTASSEIPATQSSVINFTSPRNSGKTVDIKVPTQGETFIDQRPLFKGTSYPNSSVTISIPGVVDQDVLTLPDGSWTFRADNNFPQGKHVLSIASKDTNNNPTSVSRNFTIFPQGNQIAESATPSATPVVLPTATTAPSPTPTVTATATPTSIPTGEVVTITPTVTIVTPTSIATSSPTLTVNPTVFFTPTITPTIKNPGGASNTIILTVVSVILIIGGTALLFAL